MSEREKRKQYYYCLHPLAGVQNELPKLQAAAQKFYENGVYNDAYACLYQAFDNGDQYTTYPIIRDMRNDLINRIKAGEFNDKTGNEVWKILKKMYMITAPAVFEDFLIFTEWDRPYEQKFYQPRMNGLKPLVKAMQKLADDELDLLCISCPPGIGKALADDTPVMTRNGWKNHGDIQVGDEVIGLDGKFKKVIDVSPKYQLDRLVEFTNGVKIQCHEHHEWVIYSRNRENELRKIPMLAETQAIEKMKLEMGGEAGHRGHRYQISLPYIEPVVGEEKELPCDPYCLGVWLGDGNNRAPTICSDVKDRAVLQEVGKHYKIRRMWIQKDTGVLYCNYDMRKELRACGMCVDTRPTEKRIPEEYLTASIQQRLELLAGLIDTDGCIADEHKIQFSTTDLQLKETFCELVSTFGWRYTVYEAAPKVSTSGIRGKKMLYNIRFCPKMSIPCRLSRKQMITFAKPRRIYLKSITKVEPKQGNCITVEDGIYLVGKDFTPTHNTGLATFYITWMAGRHPELSILVGSHSQSFLKGVYEECLREMDKEGDYHWGQAFPGHSVVKTNAADLKIDVDKPRRFSALQYASVGSEMAGKVRATNLLYLDDLIGRLEEALNPDTLEKIWQSYTTDYRQRKQGHCKELHIATRWATRDVIGRIKESNEGDPRCCFLEFPALNENDESNFAYGGDNGFSTEFYHNLREDMDRASWDALYMARPIDRNALLYEDELLRKYYDLPLVEPDAILAVCDTAEGKGDYTVMPIYYVYGNDHYMVDCVCSDALPEVTDELCASALVKYKVQQCQFESNAAGGRTADKIEELITAKVSQQGGRKTQVLKKRTTVNKETKIVVNSSWVKAHCLFLDDKRIQKGTPYFHFMKMMRSYATGVKNKHDDVPDVLAQYALFTDNLIGTVATVVRRPF